MLKQQADSGPRDQALSAGTRYGRTSEKALKATMSKQQVGTGHTWPGMGEPQGPARINAETASRQRLQDTERSLQQLDMGKRYGPEKQQCRNSKSAVVAQK